jgi:hypothetical protein
MKTTRVLNQFARKLLAAAALALLTGGTAWAQIPVTSAGGGPLTFNTLPPASQWSYRSITGGGATYTDAAGITTFVNGGTVTAASITTGLTTDTANPPGTSANGRWNSTLQVIQTRPTGNAATLLMGTFINNSGSTINDMDLSFTFAVYSALSGQLPGHEVYYSLTGNGTDWVKITSLSDDETAGTHSANFTALNWGAGSLLYLLFVDDNADAISDPSYTMDNVSISFPGQPPVIVQNPAGQTNAEYSVVTLNVAAGGTPPLTYQWQKNGTDIPGATGTTLVLTNTTGSGFTYSRPQDSGDYTVVVSGSVAPPATSNPAHVVILPDTNAPTFLWAIRDTNGAGNLVIRVGLSEPLANNTIDYLDNLYWYVPATSAGGSDLGSPDSVALTNVVASVNHKSYLEIQLTFGAVTVDPSTTYRVDYDTGASGATLFDRAQTPNNMAVMSSPFWAHQASVLSFDDSWKYSDVNLPAPAGWQNLGFDDSDTSFWKSGPGPLDGKRVDGQPPATWCRTTADANFQLPTIGTCLVLSNATAPGNIATYYFRTTFQYNNQVQSNAMLRLTGKFDDGAVVYLNGTEITRIGVGATNTLSHSNYNSSRTVGNEAPDNEYIFPGTLLHSGPNVIAVNLCQVNLSSSDITMGLKITGATVAPLTPVVLGPRMTIQPVGSDLSISWTPAGGKLVSGPTITGPWTTNDTPSNPTTVTPNQAQRYYFISQ